MSEYLDYLGDVEDTKDKINDLALKMYQQGRHDAEKELNALGECEYNKGAEDFAEWLATKRGFSKEWVEWHIDHWKKGAENE